MLLALPLGELSPQVTERAHAVSPDAEVSDAIRNFPAMPKAPSPRGLSSECETGGVHPPKDLPPFLRFWAVSVKFLKIRAGGFAKPDGFMLYLS